MFPSLKFKEDNRIAIKEIEKIDDKYDVQKLIKTSIFMFQRLL